MYNGNLAQSHDSLRLFQQVRERDAQGAVELYDRYAVRLVGLVRQQLAARFQRHFDAEDVVQSAFRSFFRRAEAGELTIEQNGQLWRLLAAITVHKALKRVEHFSRQKRGGNGAGAPGGHSTRDEAQLAALVDQGPTPDQAAMLLEEVTRVWSKLDGLSRVVLEMDLQGATHGEIAAAVYRSERTVRRTLDTIRHELEETLLENPEGS